MSSKLFNNLFSSLAVALSLFSLIGCATASTPNPNSTPVPRRTFVDLHVYSATSGTANQFYDSTIDKILGEDIWVFRPNGTYSAIVNVGGKILTLSGVYSGDDVGDDFIFSIETNNDSKFDESLYSDDNFSFIEWRHKSGTLKYLLAK